MFESAMNMIAHTSFITVRYLTHSPKLLNCNTIVNLSASHWLTLAPNGDGARPLGPSSRLLKTFCSCNKSVLRLLADRALDRALKFAMLVAFRVIRYFLHVCLACQFLLLGRRATSHGAPQVSCRLLWLLIWMERADFWLSGSWAGSKISVYKTVHWHRSVQAWPWGLVVTVFYRLPRDSRRLISLHCKLVMDIRLFIGLCDVGTLLGTHSWYSDLFDLGTLF